MLNTILNFWHMMCYPSSIWMMLFDYFLINGVLMGLRCLATERDALPARILQYFVGILLTFMCLGCFEIMSWLEAHDPNTQNIFVFLAFGIAFLGSFFAAFSFLLGQAAMLWGSWMSDDYGLEFR